MKCINSGGSQYLSVYRTFCRVLQPNVEFILAFCVYFDISVHWAFCFTWAFCVHCAICTLSLPYSFCLLCSLALCVHCVLSVHLTLILCPHSLLCILSNFTLCVCWAFILSPLSIGSSRLVPLCLLYPLSLLCPLSILFQPALFSLCCLSVFTEPSTVDPLLSEHLVTHPCSYYSENFYMTAQEADYMLLAICLSDGFLSSNTLQTQPFLHIV